MVELGGSLGLLEEGLGGAAAAGGEAEGSTLSGAASPEAASSSSSSRLSVTVRGTLRNFNTAPQFTSADKNGIFSDLALEVRGAC